MKDEAGRGEARRRVLYVTHRAPFPQNKGERIRCFHLLEFLARRATVDLATLADEPFSDEARAVLAARCDRLAAVPVGGAGRWARALWWLGTGRTASEGAFWARALWRTIGQWAATARYHAVLISASSLAPYLRHPALAGATRVVDLIDVDSQKWLDYAAGRWGPRAWLHWVEGRRLRGVESRLAADARGVAVVTAAEIALLRRFCPHGDVREASCGIDLDQFRPGAVPQPEADVPTCVFVGALDYHPNVDGVSWFCREVWPAVHRAHPEARVQLVGRHATGAVRALGQLPGVEFVGEVHDVREHVARATVSVVPLRIARGIQNKALESLAMGKATVVSPAVLGGLRTVAGTHVLSAGTPAEWAAALGRLFADPAERRRLGEAGRRFVEEHHRWERCLAPFAELLGLPA